MKRTIRTALKATLVLPISLILTTLATSPSLASTLTYATEVVEYEPGNGIIYDDRKNPENALGAPDEDFLALGLEGEAILRFGTLFSNRVTVWETTFGSGIGWEEYTDVFVGNRINSEYVWDSIGNIFNLDAQNGYTLNIGNNNTYEFVKFVDKSPSGEGRDGFDINAVAVKAKSVPESTSALGVMALAVFVAGSGKRQQLQTDEDLASDD